jgi:hypothetical protein
MFQKPRQMTWIPWGTLMSVTSGCDDRATQIAREAANRQDQQNTAMSELNKEVAAGTRDLVAADSQARKEIVGVHHELQAERTRLDTGWDALEKVRQHIAGERRTESMLVPAVEVFGGLALVILLLGFCWYALVAARRGDDSDGQLNELLVCEILTDTPPLLAHSQQARNLLERSRPEDGPDN